MVPLIRDTEVQRGPQGSLLGFPTRNFTKRLWRFAKQSPWWHCSDLACRFDLRAPKGTCYLGTDELVGILESIGPEIQNGIVSRAYVNERLLYSAKPDPKLRFADLTNRRAIKYRVTNELSTMTPYRIPQLWAQEFEKFLSGVSYRSRFDLSSEQRSVALFGPAGLSLRASGQGKSVSYSVQMRLLNECGVSIAGPPPLSQMIVYEDAE